MVVYHANRLHKGVYNRWAHKFKPFFEKSLTERFSKWVKAGTSAIVVYLLIIGLWSTKLQQKRQSYHTSFG